MRNVSMLALAGLVLALASSASRADPENSDITQVADADRAFLDATAVRDQNEIALSRIAFSKSANPAVRTFARQMLDDHTANLRDVQALASRKNVVLSPDMDGPHAQVLRKLQAAKADDSFDALYMSAMVEDHGGMDTLLDRTIGTTNDGEIRAFASATQTVIKRHEAAAGDLSRR